MSIITSPSSSPSLSRATRSRVHNKRRTVFTDESTAMLNLVAGESVLSQTEKVDKAFGMLQRSGNSHPKLKSHIRKFFRKLEDELEENIYKSQEEYAALNWSPVNDPDKVLESPVDPEKPGSDFAKYTTICRYPNRSDFSVHDIFLLRSVALDRLIQLLCHPFRSCEGIEKAFFLTYILELRGSAILGSIVRLVETFQKCKEPFILSLWYQKTSLFLINWMALHWEDWVDLVNEPDFSQYKSLVQQGIETFLGRKIVPTEDDAAVEEGNLKPSWSRVVALANPPDTLQRDVELSLFSVEEAVDSGGVGVSSIARFLEQNILKAKRRLCASSKAFENLLRKYNDLNQLSLSPDSPSLNQPKSTTPTLGSKNFFRRQKTNEQLNVPCSRCGQEFVGIKRCATCKNEYCHPCAKLPMLKNACNDGNRHTFHDPESREIKRLGSLKNPLSSSIASSVLSASSPPIPKPCVVCQGSGMMCTNCGDYFCWKCSQLAAFKNMCSHQFEGPIKKNCKRCGEEDAPVQCIVCDFTYCVTCSRLPPLQNICTTGSRHNFIGEEKEMEVKECVAACSRCGQEGVGEMKTCTQCNNKYCLRCALLPVFKNNCSKGPKHTFADAPSPPLSPDLRTKKPQGEKKVPPGKPSRPSRPPPRPCSPLLSGSRPPNDGTPLSPERKSCPNPTSPSLPPFPPLDNHLASPDMGPRFSIDSFTPSSPNETPLPQPLSHARPPSPLGIGEPVANPQSPPLQSKRCGKCGKRKENILNYCESCELDFCGECSKLPDVRNVCSKGGNHAFGEEEKEKENSDSDLVAACSFCTSERNLRQCLICSNIVCALCVGTTTIKCLPGKKHNYVVRSRSGSRTRSLGICDTAVGLILGEDETDENECSRCGTSVNVRECLVCQSFYCPSCSLLAGFKNMCTNGSKHSFGSMNAKPEILIVNDELNCCSRCGEEHKNAVKCLKCQDYYCSKCSLLSASRNVCPNGAKHTFEEENKKGDEKKEEGNSGWIVRRTSTGGQAEKKVFRENQNSSFSAVSSGGEDSPRSSFLTQRGRSGTKSPENQSTITKPSTPSQLPNSRIPKSSLREGDGNSSVHKRLVHSPQRATIGSSPSSPVSPSSPMTSASPSSPLSSLSSSPSSLSVTPSPSSNMNMALKGMAFLSDPHLRKTGESDQFPRFRSEQMLKTIDTKHLSCCRCLRVASICCTICDRVFCDTCKVLPLLKENCISGECHSFPNEPPPDVRVKFKSVFFFSFFQKRDEKREEI